jgi:antitoxin (DNA-binding transcriptional repressor) of toxin-antitoxin stability system
MHEAKTNLSRPVDRAANWELFVIARAGKPLVQVNKLDAAPAREPRKLGFLEGEYTVPEDFDTMFQAEIEEMFYGAPKA